MSHSYEKSEVSAKQWVTQEMAGERLTLIMDRGSSLACEFRVFVSESRTSN